MKIPHPPGSLRGLGGADEAGLELVFTVRLEVLPYRNVDISKFYPYGDVSFPE